ncbi:hypothetical protein Hdeb2414_s0938g00964161 [Helianthus debilis subsp. tardiflorus]
MILHIFIFSITLIITSPSATSAQPNCNQVCTGNANPVPYPFGFSEGCEIRLNCSNSGEIRVGEYYVQNITSDHILISFPSKCDRPFEQIRQFNATNFAITSENGLRVSNCSSTLSLSSCAMTSNRVGSYTFPQCDNVTINCYWEEKPDRVEFINLKTLEAAGCQFLFSSVRFNFTGSNPQSWPVPSEFQAIELGWWVRGDCGCDQNAVCRSVSFENQAVGYRCYCNEGYTGDGFVGGLGCLRG